MSDTPEVLEPAPEAAADECCSNCGVSIKNSKVGWCTSCGFYPRLGTFVELDPWDKPAAAEAEPEKKPSVRDYLARVPAWVWKLVVALAAVVAVSIVGRLVTPPDSDARTIWCVSQWGIGMVAFIGAHVASYLVAIMDTDRINVLDIVLKPLSIWVKTFQQLPGSFWRIAIGACGYLAATLAVSVVGGMPYHLLWDWKVEERPKSNLAQAIAAAAQNGGEGADNLEDAVEDFAGKKADAAADELAKKRAAELARPMKCDCVIAGYLPSGDGDFQSLVLLSEVKGKLRCVGTLREGIPEEARKRIIERLVTIQRQKPFVPCDVPGAQWVEPRLTVRVRFAAWTSSNRLDKPLFVDLLAEVSAN